MAKRGGLGRGLDSLLGAAKAPEVKVQPAVSKQQPKKQVTEPARPNPEQEAGHDELVDGTLRTLPVDLLKRGRFQPRQDFDQEALEELASSIRVQGVIQPIVVRPLESDEAGRYEIVAGERRWRAAQLAGLQEIPAVVKQVSDRDTMAMALIENIQRESLNPIEEATALQRLIDEFELTQQQAADAIGRSRSSVTNLLRLLNLNAEVGLMVEQGRLEMGHARALLGLEGKQQIDAAKQVVLMGLSVREAEKLVRRLLQPAKSQTTAPKEIDPNVRRLQNDLSERLGATAAIQQGTRGKGKLIIQYNSLDELDGILEHIR